MAKSSRATTYLNSYRRVLIARFSALGDVAMTIPVLYSVCRVNPDTHFVMLTTKFAAQLFVNAPANLEVKGIDKQQYQGIRGAPNRQRAGRKASPDTESQQAVAAADIVACSLPRSV